MSELTETIEINGKRYTLTKYELYRANQMYDVIPRADKTEDDWKWVVEMALQETQIKEKQSNNIEAINKQSTNL